LITIAEPTQVQLEHGRTIFFVVEPDRAGLAALESRLRDGRLRPIIGAVCSLAEAPSAFDPGCRSRGKTIVAIADAD
ncbi:MAG TPA: NADP-dependent oxidoreductase, partial [Mycobacterium sp.]|nr:NADP-dependent oxidoreductase [Mycobacterium sp.]